MWVAFLQITVTYLQVNHENDIYDKVGEEEYEQIVSRRQRQKDFVVDSDGEVDEDYLDNGGCKDDQVRRSSISIWISRFFYFTSANILQISFVLPPPPFFVHQIPALTLQVRSSLKLRSTKRR